jgi:hypothetical protein
VSQGRSRQRVGVKTLRSGGHEASAAGVAFRRPPKFALARGGEPVRLREYLRVCRLSTPSLWFR